MQCPQCKAKGVITITIHTGDAVTKQEMKCPLCGGKRAVIKSTAQAYFQEVDSWCNCGNPSGHAVYHPDHGKVKHHYDCNDCGKLLQIG
jgi:hypothetical protein